jgi:NADH-quinone oxidoreductase subunit G
MEIVTQSEPGFDSYFSGNTTDICPVGALTTADFRFKARPWEMMATASICSHCPVGCNITFNVRREAAGGGWAIRRVMPRQNESVNEIWLCDKGRFGHHYTRSPQRLAQPLARKDGQLVPINWEEALELGVAKLRAVGSNLLTLVGGRLPNEDLFNLRQLTQHLGGRAVLDTYMAGGDLAAWAGLSQGSNLADLGKGSVILIVACDLAEEAPIWWLRVRQAVRRGAHLIVANPRPTKAESSAAQVVRYAYEEEAKITIPEPSPENLVIFYGSEGLGLSGSQALADACASLLLASGKAGKPNSGIVPVWPRANDQGAWDLGYRPADDLREALQAAGVVYIAGADPVQDIQVTKMSPFVIVQELFLTDTARQADLVLPVQSYVEREGTFTSAERRVQRFYPAVPALEGPRPDFTIAAQLAERLGLALEDSIPERVFAQLAALTPGYEGLSYARLAEVSEQWPIVGRDSVYYGGTTYENTQGLGVQLPAAKAPQATPSPLAPLPEGERGNDPGSILTIPVTRLYDRGVTLLPSTLLDQRRAGPWLMLNPVDAGRLGVTGGPAQAKFNGLAFDVEVRLSPDVPAGVALVPRSVGLPVREPVVIEL